MRSTLKKMAFKAGFNNGPNFEKHRWMDKDILVG